MSPAVVELDEADLELVEAARAILVKHYKPHWHTVGAALRSRDGRIWTGVHLGATVGRLSVCAEAVALGRAILEGDGTVECAVAVRHPKAEESVRDIAVVPPCGACREMLTDFDPAADVIVQGPGGLQRIPVRILLPLPYQR
ncbi:cytidine deaminase [Acidisphaera sp. L21]|uniref:cytidine deaminase n=1 Tax=Acidisphaera sp. L21 TaxID=1641851 RepID=UPI00131ABACE|nr:cytidine deaminase [Acidisphaera sp. L21]